MVNRRNGEHKLDLPNVELSPKTEILTIWFNVWKYESGNQVWAGLVDTIIEQVAARLELPDREMFYVRLNLNRLDVNSIRQKIHNYIFQAWWYKVRGWLMGVGTLLITTLAIALYGLAAGSSLGQKLGWGGAILSALIGTVITALGGWQTRKEIEDEPAKMSLDELLDVPPYDKEVGFVHQVEADLKRVLASLPRSDQNKREIVIFVDDLDRCYPDKIAQVMSAINQFLAGDFANCYFVLGMDTEMVAAALQAAHKDMISYLPADARTPIGWRFMDKFVQLPVLIPPPEKERLEHYTDSLFASENTTTLTPEEVENLAQKIAEHISDPGRVAEEAAEGVAEEVAHGNLSDTETALLEDLAIIFYDRRILDEGIVRFNDSNPEIRERVEAASKYLEGNPRDLKRFVNCFRFYYWLWWWRKSRKLENPTLDQLVRWLILCLKWPEVARWLRRSGGSDWLITSGNPIPSLVKRLKTLEKLGEDCTDLSAWQEQALCTFHLTPDESAWLGDDHLWQFFVRESGLKDRRLSDGQGKGFW